MYIEGHIRQSCGDYNFELRGISGHGVMYHNSNTTGWGARGGKQMIVILMGRLLISLNRSTLAQLELGQEENFVGSGQGREVYFKTLQYYRPM